MERRHLRFEHSLNLLWFFFLSWKELQDVFYSWKRVKNEKLKKSVYDSSDVTRKQDARSRAVEMFAVPCNVNPISKIKHYIAILTVIHFVSTVLAGSSDCWNKYLRMCWTVTVIINVCYQVRRCKSVLATVQTSTFLLHCSLFSRFTSSGPRPSRQSDNRHNSLLSSSTLRLTAILRVSLFNNRRVLNPSPN